MYFGFVKVEILIFWQINFNKKILQKGKKQILASTIFIIITALYGSFRKNSTLIMPIQLHFISSVIRTKNEYNRRVSSQFSKNFTSVSNVILRPIIVIITARKSSLTHFLAFPRDNNVVVRSGY